MQFAFQAVAHVDQRPRQRRQRPVEVRRRRLFDKFPQDPISLCLHRQCHQTGDECRTFGRVSDGGVSRLQPLQGLVEAPLGRVASRLQQHDFLETPHRLQFGQHDLDELLLAYRQFPIAASAAAGEAGEIQGRAVEQPLEGGVAALG